MATENKTEIKNLEAEVDPMNLLGKMVISKHCKNQIRGAMIIAYSLEKKYIEAVCGCGKVHRYQYNGDAQ